MKSIISLSVLFSLLLLGFAALDLANVIWQYNKHLGEPYDLYSWTGVSVVGGVISFSCLSGWFIWIKSKNMTAPWQKAALVQLFLSLSALAIFAFVFIGPYGTVRT
jgi:hypothetical protein